MIFRSTFNKIFNLDAALKLVKHNGKCAYLHGHTYNLTSVIKDKDTFRTKILLSHLKLEDVVKIEIVDKIDYSFLAQGNEPVISQLERKTGSKWFLLGFRTSCEKLVVYICFKCK